MRGKILCQCDVPLSSGFSPICKKEQTHICPTINQIFLKLCLPFFQLRATRNTSRSSILNVCEALKPLCQSFKVTYFSLMLYLKRLVFLGLCFTYKILLLGLKVMHHHNHRLSQEPSLLGQFSLNFAVFTCLCLSS